jgi:hypothetical protein
MLDQDFGSYRMSLVNAKTRKLHATDIEDS